MALMNLSTVLMSNAERYRSRDISLSIYEWKRKLNRKHDDTLEGTITCGRTIFLFIQMSINKVL